MVMNPKSSFTIKLLEKIGAPLIKAVEKRAPSGEENAEIVARLLGQAVKMSIALNGTLGVEENEEQADSTRMALAAIVSPLLADHFETHQKEPEVQDTQRMIKSLEVVMSFADKFQPAQEGQSRLSTIDHATPFFDETQGVLNTMLAMTPVIPAIYEFSFGQEENKLMQDVSARLEAKAVELAGDNKIGQILVLKALAGIYADCHRAATAQMAQSQDGDRQSPTMEPIWQDFDKRALMLGAIAGQENSGSASMPMAPIPAAQEDVQQAPAETNQAAVAASTEEAQPGAEPQKPAIFGNAPAETSTADASTAQDTPSAPAPVAPPAETPAPAEQAQPAAASGGGGPMSFFSKGGDDASPATPAPAGQPAPVAETPATPPAPAETPPAAPAQEATSGNFAESGKPDESGNPMSFFGKKKDGE